MQAELEHIQQWGNDEREAITAIVKAEETSINNLAPVIEQAKSEAAPKVQAELSGIAEWSRIQRAEAVKVLDLQKDAIKQQMNDSLFDIQTEQTNIKHQLSLLFNDARDGADDVQKQLSITQDGERELTTKLAALQKKISGSSSNAPYHRRTGGRKE